MKKYLAIALAAVMLLATLAACGGNNTANNGGATNNSSTNDSTTNNTAGGDTSTEISGTVNTNGSTSMESVMGSLIEAFGSVQPDVTVNYTPSGSGAGITGAQDGTCDIGLASRDLKDDETGVKQITVAKDGIAIVVNPENPVSDLSIEQIAAMATARSPTGPRWAAATARWSSWAARPAPAPGTALSPSPAPRTPATTRTSTPPPAK